MTQVQNHDETEHRQQHQDSREENTKWKLAMLSSGFAVFSSVCAIAISALQYHETSKTNAMTAEINAWQLFFPEVDTSNLLVSYEPQADQANVLILARNRGELPAAMHFDYYFDVRSCRLRGNSIVEYVGDETIPFQNTKTFGPGQSTTFEYVVPNFLDHISTNFSPLPNEHEDMVLTLYTATHTPVITYMPELASLVRTPPLPTLDYDRVQNIPELSYTNETQIPFSIRWSEDGEVLLSYSPPEEHCVGLMQIAREQRLANWN